MNTNRVFRSGNSQAVRLPKQFRLNSQEVEIFRRGDEIVLRERGGTMARAFDLLEGSEEYASRHACFGLLLRSDILSAQDML